MRCIKHQIIEIVFIDRYLIGKSCLSNVYVSDYLLFGFSSDSNVCLAWPYSLHGTKIDIYIVEISLTVQSICFLFVSETAPESFGVITGIVPDDAFTASSSLADSSGPERGRALVKEVGSFAGRVLFGAARSNEC